MTSDREVTIYFSDKGRAPETIISKEGCRIEGDWFLTDSREGPRVYYFNRDLIEYVTVENHTLDVKGTP